MSGHDAGPLIVDGYRPMVEHVAALGRDRVTPTERLVLLALACDGYKDASAPGYDNLAAWTGLHRSTVVGIVSKLLKPSEQRPALLLIEEAGRSGRRTRWRLLLPVTTEAPRASATRARGKIGKKPDADAEPRESWDAPVGGTDQSVSTTSQWAGSGQSSGRSSGQLSGRSSGQCDRPLPVPTPVPTLFSRPPSRSPIQANRAAAEPATAAPPDGDETDPNTAETTKDRVEHVRRQIKPLGTRTTRDDHRDTRCPNRRRYAVDGTCCQDDPDVESPCPSPAYNTNPATRGATP